MENKIMVHWMDPPTTVGDVLRYRIIGEKSVSAFYPYSNNIFPVSYTISRLPANPAYLQLTSHLWKGS